MQLFGVLLRGPLQWRVVGLPGARVGADVLVGVPGVRLWVPEVAGVGCGEFLQARERAFLAREMRVFWRGKRAFLLAREMRVF